MRHTRLGILLGLLSLLIAPAVAFAQEGTVEVGEITSAALEGNLIGDSATRSFAIYLPPSYETSQRWYPVFYSLTGYGITASKSLAWIQGSIRLEMDKAIRNGDIGEIIVVFLDGYNKFGGSYYLSSPTTGDWETYIVRDVVDYVDMHYRTIPHRNSRVIDGHSMGGFGAMHLALKYPGVFSVVVAQAGLYDFSADFGTGKTGPWEAGATAWVDPRTWDEFGSLDWRTQAWFAIAAATAPNPDRPPFFLDKPHALVDGQPQIVPEVFERMVDKDVVRDLERYVRHPVRLKGIKIVHGTGDDIVPVEQARILDRKLTDVGIDHVYVEHGGGHDTFLNESLTFFPAHLRFVPAETPAVVSAPTALGSAVTGQPIPLEVTVVLDAPLESTQALLRMSLDLSPLGIPSQLPVRHVGGGRYTGSTTITPLETGQYNLPLMVETEEGEQYSLLRLVLEVSPEEGEGPQDGGFENPEWMLFTPENWGGLPTEGVFGLAIDPQGNAWLSSWEALVKFDGATWTTYTTDDSELPGGWGLAVDAQGTVWAGGGGVLAFSSGIAGVARFDGETWTVYRPDNSEMPARKAYALTPDRHGNMWMGTELGLVVYREGGVILPGEETAVEEKNRAQVPLAFALSQNYPNPFNLITTIAYDLSQASDVTLALYTIAGQKVTALVDAHQQAGHHTAMFDGSDLATGVYLYRLKAGGFVGTKRMLLLR